MPEGSTVSLAVDTTATVGTVIYPTATTWECLVSSLVDGVNNITVTADDSGLSVSEQAAIVKMQNTIIVQKAEYWGTKNTLTVEVTSDLGASANLSVDDWGPLDWDSKTSKWIKVFSGVASAPENITVSGTEGSVTVPVSVR
jgi:hypothetical protein